jgi:hypothetical protein
MEEHKRELEDRIFQEVVHKSVLRKDEIVKTLKRVIVRVEEFPTAKVEE